MVRLCQAGAWAHQSRPHGPSLWSVGSVWRPVDFIYLNLMAPSMFWFRKELAITGNITRPRKKAQQIYWKVSKINEDTNVSL